MPTNDRHPAPAARPRDPRQRNHGETSTNQRIARSLPWSRVASRPYGIAIALVVTLVGLIRPAGAACTPGLASGTAARLQSGGKILVNPEVNLIFWGSDWNGNNNPSIAQVVAQVRDIVSGPIVTELNQYGVEAATLFPGVDYVPGTFVKDPTTTQQYAVLADMITMITAQMSLGHLQAPKSNVDRLYFAMLPNAVKFVSSEQFPQVLEANGAHLAATFNGTKFYFGFSLNRTPNNSPNGNDGPAVFSHEFVEAATDPDPLGNYAWKVDGTTSSLKNAEIADVCCNHGASIHNNVNFSQNAFWSQRAGKCVVPASWDSIWAYAGSGTNWALATTNPTHQLVSGSYALAVLDDYDNVWVGNGSLGWVNARWPGGVGSSAVTNMLAVTKESVYARTTGGIVYRFDGDSSWTNIGTPVAPSMSTLTGLSGIYGGDFGIFATDTSGGAYQYSPTSRTWTFVRSGMSQIAVSGRGVYMVSGDHSTIDYGSSLTNLRGGFTSVGVSVTNAYAGPGGVAVTDIATQDVLWYNEQGGTWTLQGGPGYAFAVTGTLSGPNLFGQTTDRSQIYQSTNLSANLPTWSLIWTVGGAPSGVLVGGGSGLFATGNIRYANASDPGTYLF